MRERERERERECVDEEKWYEIVEKKRDNFERKDKQVKIQRGKERNNNNTHTQGKRER